MVRGIRNSFGIAWDPITGNLWDTENGPHFGDEINLVELGFNSGWVKIQGVWKPRFDERGELSLNANRTSFLWWKGKKQRIQIYLDSNRRSNRNVYKDNYSSLSSKDRKS